MWGTGIKTLRLIHHFKILNMFSYLAQTKTKSPTGRCAKNNGPRHYIPLKQAGHTVGDFCGVKPGG